MRDASACMRAKGMYAACFGGNDRIFRYVDDVYALSSAIE